MSTDLMNAKLPFSNSVDPSPTTAWTGEDPNESVTVLAYLTANKDVPVPSPQEALDHYEFYSGRSQWPKDVLAARNKSQRPALVINRLPMIAASLLASSVKAGQAVSQLDLSRMVYLIVRNNRDAQMIHNIVASAHAEETALHAKPQMIYSPQSVDIIDGVIHVKPPRGMHRSWIVRLLDRITRWIDQKA